MHVYRLGEPSDDGEMIEMTLPSRHGIRNLNPGSLRQRTLPLGHGGTPLLREDGEETLLFFQTAETAAVLTTTLGPPSQNKIKSYL